MSGSCTKKEGAVSSGSTHSRDFSVHPGPDGTDLTSVPGRVLPSLSPNTLLVHVSSDKKVIPKVPSLLVDSKTVSETCPECDRSR